MEKRINKALMVVREAGIDEADVGIILGSGLGGLIDQIQVLTTVEYSTIPGFAIATVETHEGRLVYGTLSGKKILAMHGRFHYYEGYGMESITFPIYVMKALGIKYLFISNAAGNLNRNWSKGELMLIEDHIDLLPENPLRGKNADKLGPRFPDMVEPYSKFLNGHLQAVAAEQKIVLRNGIYAAVKGPNMETRAEYRMLGILGADAVGMSTVPEVIVAKFLDIPVCAISVLTDDCDPDNLLPVNIEEIFAIARSAEKQLTSLVSAAVGKV